MVSRMRRGLSRMKLKKEIMMDLIPRNSLNKKNEEEDSVHHFPTSTWTRCSGRTDLVGGRAYISLPLEVK